MAQFVFLNWQDDDSTKNLNHRGLGVLVPGVYKGYDVNLNVPGGTVLRLSMADGADFTLYDEVHTVEKRGVILTKQGVNIQENEDIDLVFTPNTSSHPRIDLVILEHEYVDVQDGSQGIYSIELGTPSSTPVAPTLAEAEIKIVIGELYVPAGALTVNSAGVVFTKSPVPTLANDPTIVRTFNEQTVTGHKKFDSFSGASWKSTTYNSGTKTLSATVQGNFFKETGNSTAIIDVENLGGSFEDMPATTMVWLRVSSRLRLVAGDSFTFLPDIQNDYMLIEGGETLLLVKDSGTSWYVCAGGSAQRYAINKFMLGQVWGKAASAGTISDGLLNRSLSDANYIDVNVTSANQQLKFLTSSRLNGYDFPNPEAGGIMILHFTSNAAIIVADSAGAPADAKPINTAGAGNISCPVNSMVVLIEDGTTWRVVSVYSSTANFNSVYSAIADEIAARENADESLADSIAAEIIARTDADTDLQDQIDDETLARISADNALNGRIGVVENAWISSSPGVSSSSNCNSFSFVGNSDEFRWKVFGKTAIVRFRYTVNVTATGTVFLVLTMPFSLTGREPQSSSVLLYIQQGDTVISGIGECRIGNSSDYTKMVHTIANVGTTGTMIVSGVATFEIV